MKQTRYVNSHQSTPTMYPRKRELSLRSSRKHGGRGKGAHLKNCFMAKIKFSHNPKKPRAQSTKARINVTRVSTKLLAKMSGSYVQLIFDVFLKITFSVYENETSCVCGVFFTRLVGQFEQTTPALE